MYKNLPWLKFGNLEQVFNELVIYVEDVLPQLEKNNMANEEFINNEDDLGEVKELLVTRNELLYLSDSVTLLMEHTSDNGRTHIPARQ